MSVQWTPGDLRAFYKKEARETHSQMVARRGLLILGMLTGLLLAIAAFGHRYFGWWMK